jgi:hypothetical protein
VTGRSGQQRHASEFGQDSRKLLEMKRVEARTLVEFAPSGLIAVQKTSCGLSVSRSRSRR